MVRGKGSRPSLWVRVTNPDTGRSIIALALIDTGADACAFPTEIAERLGHNLRAVIPKKMCTANRHTCAYPHTSIVNILAINPDGRPNNNKILYTIPNQVIDYTEGLGAFLLGQNDFLSRFILKIDYPNRSVSIRYPQKQKKKIKKRR